MFRDIKPQMDTPEVRRILADCVFDNSPEGLTKDIAKYQANEDMLCWGWYDGGELAGVCGFEEHANRVEIMHIAVAEATRRKGLGWAMVSALLENYGKPIEAETDDDAVAFYRKCGFETTALQKYDVRRWECVLPHRGQKEEAQ